MDELQMMSHRREADTIVDVHPQTVKARVDSMGSALASSSVAAAITSTCGTGGSL